MNKGALRGKENVALEKPSSGILTQEGEQPELTTFCFLSLPPVVLH